MKETKVINEETIAQEYQNVEEKCRKYRASCANSYFVPMIQYIEERFPKEPSRYHVINFIKSIKLTKEYAKILISEWEVNNEKVELIEGEIHNLKLELNKTIDKQVCYGNLSEQDKKTLKHIEESEKIKVFYEYKKMGDDFDTALKMDIVCLLAMRLAEYCYLDNGDRWIFWPRIGCEKPNNVTKNEANLINNLWIAICEKENIEPQCEVEEAFYGTMRYIIENDCVPKEVWPVCAYIIYKAAKKYRAKNNAIAENIFDPEYRCLVCNPADGKIIRNNILPKICCTKGGVSSFEMFSYMLKHTELGKEYEVLNKYIFDQYTSFYDMQYYFFTYGSQFKELVKRRKYSRSAVLNKMRAGEITEKEKEDEYSSIEKRFIREMDEIFALTPMQPFFIKCWMLDNFMFTERSSVFGSLKRENIIKNVNQQIDKVVNELFQKILESQKGKHEDIVRLWIYELAEFTKREGQRLIIAEQQSMDEMFIKQYVRCKNRKIKWEYYPGYNN